MIPMILTLLSPGLLLIACLVCLFSSVCLAALSRVVSVVGRLVWLEARVLYLALPDVPVYRSRKARGISR